MATKRFKLHRPAQVMPNMTGAELISAIRELRPELPIVVCSGFCEEFTPDVAAKMGILEFLIKPVERRQLAEAVHRVLHACSGASGATNPTR